MALNYNFTDIPSDVLERYPDSVNPLLPTYFRFTLARVPNVMYFCQSANIPGMNLSEVIMPNPFVPIKAPGKLDFDELAISFIVDEGLNNWLEIKNWMRSTTNVEDYTEFKPVNTHLSTANLIILNSAKQPKLNVTFEGVFPRNLTGIDFNSSISEPDPFVVNCTFSFRSFNIERL